MTKPTALDTEGSVSHKQTHQDILALSNLASGKTMQAKQMSYFVFARSTRKINLVAKDEDRR